MSGQESGKDGQLARVAAYLRRRAPQKTAEATEALTGVPAATVRKWLDGTAFPNGLAVLRLVAAFGADFLVDVLDDPPVSLKAAALDEKRRELDQQLREFETSMKR